jgi:hypothetical protein
MKENIRRLSNKNVKYHLLIKIDFTCNFVPTNVWYQGVDNHKRRL